MTWTPVSQALPKPDSLVLASFVQVLDMAPLGAPRIRKKKYEVTPLRFTSRGWQCLGGENYGFAYEVLAWMDFPKPYREMEQEDGWEG
jgi:hypothetical protein